MILHSSFVSGKTMKKVLPESVALHSRWPCALKMLKTILELWEVNICTVIDSIVCDFGSTF